MMCFDDVVERAGVEPACRLFSGRDYSPTPGSTRGTLTKCQSLMWKNRTIFTDHPALMILF